MAIADRGHWTGEANEDRTCPRCGTTLSGQFCAACGFSPAPAAGAWSPGDAPESPFSPAPAPETPPPSSWSWFESSPRPASPPESPPASRAWPEPPPAAPEPPAVTQEPPWRAPEPPRAAQVVAEPPRFAAVPSPPSAQTAPPVPSFTGTIWAVLIASDRVYYEYMQAMGGMPSSVVTFPDQAVERRIPLAGSQMRIGRRSANRDFEPEVDLAEPPADRGVSRLHATLIAAADGTWSLLDSGSANGTLLNGRRVTTGTMVPLRDGDRINVGAWTVITVCRG